MRSITFKMIVGFMLVGLISIVLIVLLARWNTKTEFHRFVSDQQGADLVSQLADYYEKHGSWDGAQQTFQPVQSAPSAYPDPNAQQLPPSFTIADGNGLALFGGAGYHTGDEVPRRDLELGIPIKVDGDNVGTFIMERKPFPDAPRETEFIARTNLMYLYSALGAAFVALLLGILISRTLTRPIRELTTATHALSGGDLNQQVPVRSNDEMGELARAFNKMSAELARSVHTRRQMTADIAHELRTPLSLILGHAEAVHDGVLPPSRENFEIIREEAGRLEHLVEDLRTLSLADAGELKLNPQSISIPKLLQDLAALYQFQTQKKNISLQVDVSPLPALTVDPARITQVLTNILDNALRHTPEGGRVTLAAKLTPGGVELSIRDSGPGLACEDLERIFDRLYRADASRHRADGGSGLGLAIAKSIVHAHGGQIHAESKIGDGLLVVITLPETPVVEA
jgi:signal transduction histidine kinase